MLEWKGPRLARPFLFVAPDRKLVAIRVGELEAPAAGKGEDRLDDPAAGRFHAGEGVFQIVGKEDDERPAGGVDRRERRETAGEAFPSWNSQYSGP